MFVAWELSLHSFRVGVWQFSLWSFRFGTLALGHALRSFRLETLARKRLFLEAFAWEFSFQSFDEDLPLEIVRDRSLGNARQACAGKLGLSLLGTVRLGTSV